MAGASTSGKGKTIGRAAVQAKPAHHSAAHQRAGGPSVSKKNDSKNNIQAAASEKKIQAKLQVGSPGDRFEVEADAMADKVVKMKDADVAEKQSGKQVQQKKNNQVQAKDKPGSFLMKKGTDKEKIQKKSESLFSEHLLSEGKREKYIHKKAPQQDKPERMTQESLRSPKTEYKKDLFKKDDKLQKKEELKKKEAPDKLQKKESPDKLQKSPEQKMQKAADEKAVQKVQLKASPQLKAVNTPVQAKSSTVNRVVQPASDEKKIQKKDEKLQKSPEQKLQKAPDEKQVQKVQLKVASPVAIQSKEEKLQKKDEKLQKSPEQKLQKAPDEKQVQKVQLKAASPVAIQSKEEKLQKKDEKLQKNPEQKLQKASDEKQVQKAEEKKVQQNPASHAPASGAGASHSAAKKQPANELSDAFENKLNAALSGGFALPENVRAFMEPRFNADFSAIIIHNDAQANALCVEAGAKAFAYSNHIFFASGQYNPDTEQGRWLLAHELTHTIQQGHAELSEEGKDEEAQDNHAQPAVRSKEDEKKVQKAEEKVQKAEEKKVQKVEEKKVQKAEEKKVQKAEEKKVQKAEEKKVQKAEEKKVQKAEEKKVQKVEEKKVQKAEEKKVQKVEEKKVQKVEEKKVQKAEEKKVQKAEEKKVQKQISGSAPVSVQRLGLSDILDGLAALAANVPGFTLLTVILGMNPINMESVDRSPLNILRGFIGLIPGGEILFQVMNRYGVAEKIANWIGSAVDAMGITFSAIRDAFKRFTDSLSWTDIFSPGDVWRRAKDIFIPFITRIVNFVAQLIAQAIAWLKETFMQPLSDFCRQIPGYGLVTVLLGRDPFTNAAVPRTAINVVKAFAEFIPGGTEKVQQLQESKGLQKAYDWFIQETQARNLTWDRIAGTFSAAWNSLKLEDVLTPIDTLKRIVGQFTPLFNDLVSFAGAALMKLLEVIYEAVMGAGGSMVLSIIKKSAATFKIIIQNPVGFLGNLVKAIGLGVKQFAGNILKHLQTGVVTWLTGTLTKAGVKLPATWDLKGILMFILDLLGLTYPRIRGVAVEVFGAKVVDTLETVAGLIMDIKEKGFVQTIKDRVSEFFSGLKEMILGQIKSFIQERIVMAGIAQLASLLSPVGAVIQAIIKTYQTVMFFVQKIQQILALVNSIVDSIAAIAAGSLGAAANFIEQSMARTIPLILDFLARMLGLGDISGKIKNTIEKAQEFIMQKVRQAMMWIKTTVAKLIQSLAGGKKPEDRLKAAVKDGEAILRRKNITEEKINAELPQLKQKHQLQDAKLVKSGENGFKIEVFINPKLSTPVVANENYPGSGLDPQTRTIDELWKDVVPKNKLPGESKQTESNRRAKIAEAQLLTRYSGAQQDMAKELLKNEKGQSLKPVGNIRAHEGPGHTVSRHVLNGSGQIKDKKDLALRVYTGQPGNPGKAGAYANQASASSSVKQAVQMYVGTQTWETFRKTMLANPTNHNPNVPPQAVAVPTAIIYKKSATPVPPAQLPKYLDGTIYNTYDAHGTQKKAFFFGTGSTPAFAPPIQNINYPTPVGVRQLYPGDTSKYTDPTDGKKKIVIPPSIVDPDTQTTVFVRLIVDSTKPGGYYINSSWPQ